MIKQWLKAELHAHTVEDPVDGGRIIFHSPRQLIDAAAEQGFEILSITNHNQLLFGEELEAYARGRGILLLPGVEATVEGKHVLLYNFLDYDPTWADFETVKRHKRPNQLVVAPHPFFPMPTSLGAKLARHRHLFDAIEYHGFYTRQVNFNRAAADAAKKYGLPLVGNSDVHRLYQMGCTYTLVYAEKNAGAVIEAIRRGQVQVVTQAVSAAFVSRWFVQNFLYRSQFAFRALLSALSL